MNGPIARDGAWAPRQAPAARVAATGDLHVRGPEDGRMLPGLDGLHDRADLLIITGDLTENGRLAEAEAAADLLAGARLPVVAILGNHDLRSLRRAAFRRAFERVGVELLDGESTTVALPSGLRIGIAGTTGCGGGFWPLEGPDAIHARTLRRLALRASRECAVLERCVRELDADVRIAAVHFAPTISTLGREPLVKYWMLGNGDLGVAIDRTMPDVVFHGHAHLGTLKGRTPGGVPVRNVALPVVGEVHLETLHARAAVAPEAYAYRESLACG